MNNPAWPYKKKVKGISVGGKGLCVGIWNDDRVDGWNACLEQYNKWREAQSDKALVPLNADDLRSTLEGLDVQCSLEIANLIVKKYGTLKQREIPSVEDIEAIIERCHSKNMNLGFGQRKNYVQMDTIIATAIHEMMVERMK